MSIAAIVVCVLIVVGIVSYFVIMAFWPEWVGITGRAAHKVNESHVEGSKSDDIEFVKK